MPYTPDLEAMAVNAIMWGINFAFPPFCLITQVLQKIQQDESEGLVIIPDVANPVLVANADKNGDAVSNPSSPNHINIVSCK